jgi:hypothetical protein
MASDYDDYGDFEDDLTTEEKNIIQNLREKGYAIAIMPPKELKGVSCERIEDMMLDHGISVIPILFL